MKKRQSQKRSVNMAKCSVCGSCGNVKDGLCGKCHIYKSKAKQYQSERNRRSLERRREAMRKAAFGMICDEPEAKRWPRWACS